MNLQDDHFDSNQERRIALRIPLRVLKVNTEKDGREIFFGYAKNISSGGMHIQTSNPREVGSKFDIIFELPTRKKMINCEVEVIWAHDYDPKTKVMPGMGIKFTSLSQEYMKEIKNYIEENS